MSSIYHGKQKRAWITSLLLDRLQLSTIGNDIPSPLPLLPAYFQLEGENQLIEQNDLTEFREEEEEEEKKKIRVDSLLRLIRKRAHQATTDESSTRPR